MSWGAGLAGFANGLVGGMALGNNIKRVQDEYKLQKVREQGLAEAQAMQAAAAPQVTDNGDMQNLTARPQQSVDPSAAQQPQPGSVALGMLQQNQAAGLPVSAPEQQPVADLSATPQASQAPVQQAFESASPMAGGIQLAAPKRFDVGGKQFDDKKAADAYAKSQAPAIEEFYATTLVPRMTEALTGQGKIKEAAEWQKYAEDSKTKKAMQVWGQAFQFAQLGDYNESAKRLMKLYPDYEDGFELVSSEPTKGDNGEDGFTMKVRDSNGKEQSSFHTSKSIVEMGLQQLSPIEMFNKTYSSQSKSKELEAREAIDKRNDQRTAERALGTVAVREKGLAARQEAKIEADENKINQTEAGKNKRLERAAELRTEENARKVAKGINKSDTPEKQYMAARRQVMLNPMAATMEAAEIDAEVRNVLSAAQGFANEQKPSAVPKNGTTPNPFGGGSSQVPAGKKPLIRNGGIVWVDK